MCRVLKIGGSMLLQDNFATALNRWLDVQPANPTIVIVGGGNLINAVRELERVQPVDQQQVHWTCVDLLTATARFASQWFDWPLIETQAEWKNGLKEGFCDDRPVVITPSTFYNAKTPLTDITLPIGWETTSDSIAALLAHQVQAEELVLLKSCPIPPAQTHQQLAGAGIVDASFPGIANRLATVRIEHLPRES